ncbi:MAG: hypothetical protein Q9226_003662 [Calogaya cf. arnoldii]
MLNSNGRSFSFDRRGSGYGRGEGSAVLILKPLEEAVRCGDPVRGIIRNTAVNQDGKTAGITSPSQAAQELLIQRAYANISLDPQTVDYVEAHGTGTSAGDLAEIGAIAEVFCRERTTPLYVGSVKSNLGHLESASGLAGLIKAVLTLEEGIVPPNADFQLSKAELDLDGHNIIIPAKAHLLPNLVTRRASVNSFGYGGTNAHVILEEAPSRQLTFPHMSSSSELIEGGHVPGPATHQVRPSLFVLSARSDVSLGKMVRKLIDWTAAHKNKLALGDLAYTLLIRRSHLDWRFSFVGTDHVDMLEAMRKAKLQRASSYVRLAYIFTGQGAQWHAMGRELITTTTVFKESLYRSASVVRELGASWDLIDELMVGETTSRINEVWLAQPATTAIQIALVDLLGNLGLQPHTVIGHSSGEIAAAYTAGFLSQASAMKVAYYRGLVCTLDQSSISVKGAMLAVGLSEEEATRRIRQSNIDDLSVACVNSPVSTTIAGGESSISKLHQECQDNSIFSRRLNIGTAYHSHHMFKASIQYREHLSSLEIIATEGSPKFISTVTATSKECGFGPDYWAENLTSKVHFADAVVEFCHLEDNSSELAGGRGAKQVVVEIGPHPSLSSALRQTMDRTATRFDYSYAPSLLRATNALSSLLGLLGQLHGYGVTMDLGKVNGLNSTKSDPAVVYDLPTYPWNHSHRYWHESRLSKQIRFRKHGPHYLLGTRTNTSTPLEPCWRHLIGVDTLPWLQDHVVDSLKVLPGAAYVCMAVEAARQHFADVRDLADFHIVLTDVSFRRVLVIPDAPGKVELYLSLVQPMNINKSSSSTCREFRISASVNDGPWNEHCNGLLAVHDVDDEVNSNLSPGAVTDGLTDVVVSQEEFQNNILHKEDIYYQLEMNGNRYGPAFRQIKEAQIDNLGRLISRVGAPNNVSEIVPSKMPCVHLFHPTIMDAIFHSSLPLYAQGRGSGFVMPTSIDCLRLWLRADKQPCEQLHVETFLEYQGRATARADIVAFDYDLKNLPVIRVSGIHLQGSSRYSKAQQSITEPLSILKYKPDADFLSLPTSKPSPSTATLTDGVSKVTILNHAALQYIGRGLANLQEACRLPSELHLTRLKAWMEVQLINSTSQKAFGQVITSPGKPLLETVRDLGVEGQLLCRVGENLTSIMLGQVGPVDLMFKDDLMYNFYADGPSSQCVASLSEYLEHLAFKRPNMEILEIGAGTASTSLQALASLTKSGSMPRVGHYVFTDISAGFFDKAKETLARWKDLVSFKTLDISKDPLQQGFEQHSYDLVIASNVLHATPSIKDTLTNIRAILKPLGKLAIIEVTQPHTFLGMIFGTLPGWWLGIDDGRTNNPLLTRAGWENVLLSASFTGLDVVAQDSEGPAHTSSLMITSPAVLKHSNTANTVEIVTSDDKGSYSYAIAIRLRPQLEKDGLKACLTTWQSLQYKADVIHIVIDFEQETMLLNPTLERFSQIVDLLTHPANVFWLSRGHDENHYSNPETSLINGLARSAHAENQTLRLVTLDVQDYFDLEDSSKLLSNVSKMVLRSFNLDLNRNFLTEREYVYRDGTVLIPRILPNEQLNQWHLSDPGRFNSFSLDQDGSYLVAGGLGDIGMRVCKLMARHGARHIVVLSRRREDVDVARSIQENLRTISADVKFHWRSCDISIEGQVRACIEGLSSSGIPRVKGVVQAALVIKAKVHGTRSLYAAFENSTLDFFVLLSSISGIVGTSGQASYAASNAYQDAFARSRSRPDRPCTSLNLPLIQDSNIKTSLIEQNVESHGAMTITADQLNSLLEVINANANSAMFSHFRSLPNHNLTTKAPKSIRDFKDSLLTSQDAGKTYELLAAAIMEKLSHLVAVDDNVIEERDLSIAELGMDSLIVVELRNWISTELQAPIHVSEILDQTNTWTLAHLVASRSALVNHPPDDTTHDAHRGQYGSNIGTEQGIRGPQNMTTWSSTEKLPGLLLPELRPSLDLYVESRRCFLSPRELRHTSDTIVEALQAGGIGRKLQNRLEARFSDSMIQNWLSEPYSRKIYLERRDPIHPCGTFYGGHLLIEEAHSQIQRGAIIAKAAYNFKLSLEAGRVPQDVLNGEPVCMESLHWLFDAVRKPGIGVDRMAKSSKSKHMIVMRRGHLFRVALASRGSDVVSYQDLEEALGSILSSSEIRRDSIASLTADDRDSWTKLRQHLQALHDQNAMVLEIIDSAAFVICLDDGQPTTASERVNQFFLGRPSNRWSDKTLQFVVCENGVSAFVGEHAMLDGMSVRQFNSFITQAILDHEVEPDIREPTPMDQGRVQELTFVTDTLIKNRISQIESDFCERYPPTEIVHHRIETLGGVLLRTHKCPSKAGYQVVIQLACLMYYGYQPESWETVTMSRFHMGRVDWIQAVQPPMAQFCAAALDTAVDLQQKRQLFLKAVNNFVNTMTQVARGHGFKAHMHALLAMLKEDEPLPDLFRDQAWRDTTVASVKTVKTDSLEGAMLQETAFLLPEPKCIFLHYEVEEQGCKFFVQAWPGRTKAICEALDKAAEIVKTVLLSRAANC